MTPPHHAIPPFGTYRLNSREKRARRWGAKLGISSVDRTLRSLLWRYAEGTAHRPRDVTLFNSQRVRLHPYDNICEKRVFLTPQLWEAEERAILQRFIETHQYRDFFFVDAGANVGLYSLFAKDCAGLSGQTLRCLAIEPGQTQLDRLYTNIELSGAGDSISVIPVGLGAASGKASYTADRDNLGESRVDTKTHHNRYNTNEIRIRPLAALLKDHNFPRIDALKIDIEGAEPTVLTSFFQDAERALWPRLMIIEIAHAPEITGMLNHAGYIQYHRRRGLAVYQLPE
ncbi:MAG: FkbM family methyltransferase [Pseudomonadota bacterium]